MALVQSTPSIPPHPNLVTPSTIDSTVLFRSEEAHRSKTATHSGSERPMSFQMTSFGAPPNPYQVPSNYAPASGSQTPQSSHVVGKDTSDIYLAVYSGISVYEMMVNGINVMRRRNDSWLNATQILKVAGVEKGKRTKVLEKEILPGKHEKVQGGYGKYQGTWIEYERGRDFCRQYGVEELLRPLLEYDMGQDGQSKGTMDTPTKEQAMAAQRKKMLSESRMSAHSPNGTFFKNISSTAANAVQAMNKARFESPNSRPGSAQKPRPSLGRSLSQQKSTQDSFHANSQQSMQSFHSERSFSANGQADHSLGNNPNPYLSQIKRPASGLGAYEPPRKRMRSESSSNTITPSGNTLPSDSLTMVGDNMSNTYGRHIDSLGVPPLPALVGLSAQRKKASLLSLVMVEEEDEVNGHPAFDEVAGEELDMPMDNSGHTALVWAATLGRLPLVRKLASEGANIHRVSVAGETALMKAATAVNNYERGTFPELLEVLGPTIEMRDGRGRTVLHHIAIASAIKGRSRACKYYLESLLEFVVRQGSAANSNSSSLNIETNGTLNGQSHKQKTIGLARFMSDVVNAQEMSGDTALNMAARNGNRALAQQLLEVGADPSIANNGGLKPTDFGVEGAASDGTSLQIDGLPMPSSKPDDIGAMGPPARKIGSKVAESGAEVTNSMQAIIEDAKMSYLAEARAKQALIDEARSKLSAARQSLATEQSRAQDSSRRKAARNDLRSQIQNMRKATDESTREIVQLTNAQPRSQVKIGDADAGLWIDGSLLPPQPGRAEHNGVNGDAADIGSAEFANGEHGGQVEVASLIPEHLRYATGALSPSHFLRARHSAYQTNNEHLKRETSTLKQKSSLLASQVKKILSISIGVHEDRVAGMLSGLITAIESEPGDVDMARVRELLRRVEDEEEGVSDRE